MGRPSKYSTNAERLAVKAEKQRIRRATESEATRAKRLKRMSEYQQQLREKEAKDAKQDRITKNRTRRKKTDEITNDQLDGQSTSSLLPQRNMFVIVCNSQKDSGFLGSGNSGWYRVFTITIGCRHST